MNDKLQPDISAVAMDALNLWQEHLTALASDPKAKADLAQMLEPSRRMFADWAEKAQNAMHANPPATSESATAGSASVRPASDDGALRLAQLTLHVAELEKRVAKLEVAKKPAGKSAKPSEDS